MILSILKELFRKPIARARNDAGERIESLRFTVPALRVAVLEYAPGQLQTNNSELDGKTVKLYYPPEAVSDEKFLKSLENAPVVVGGHGTTTNESNKKIDGWAHTVQYDAASKAAMISGVVKGNKEVAYIKTNLGQADFGASAFVDIFDMEIKSGITPDGQEYNAIAKELRATHVALAQHVRDPKNQIKVTNAVVVNTDGNFKDEENIMEMSDEAIVAMVKNMAAEMVKELKASVINAPRIRGIYKDLKEAQSRVDRENAKYENKHEIHKLEKVGDEYHIVADAKNAGLREVEVTYSDGTKIETSMAAHLSDADIKNYFRVGKEFNIGSGEKDKMAKVQSVKILNSRDQICVIEFQEKSWDKNSWNKDGEIEGIDEANKYIKAQEQKYPGRTYRIKKY
jgi:hypothetical protein